MSLEELMWRCSPMADQPAAVCQCKWCSSGVPEVLLKLAFTGGNTTQLLKMMHCGSNRGTLILISVKWSYLALICIHGYIMEWWDVLPLSIFWKTEKNNVVYMRQTDPALGWGPMHICLPSHKKPTHTEDNLLSDHHSIYAPSSWKGRLSGLSVYFISFFGFWFDPLSPVCLICCIRCRATFHDFGGLPKLQHRPKLPLCSFYH